jgi:hypothetical protein
MSNNDFSSKREQFEQAYWSFAHALKVASENARAQCNTMGFYNVAWEIRNDIKSGIYMLEVSNGFLSDTQKNDIREFVAAANNLPEYIFGEAVSKNQNLEVMCNPCWNPIRTQARRLTKVLEEVTKSNQSYWRGGSTQEHM